MTIHRMPVQRVNHERPVIVIGKALEAANDSRCFAEYLVLAVRDSAGKWISNEVECEVHYLLDSAENGRPARVQILSVRAEGADDVIDLLPLLCESQLADLKRTAMAHEGETA